MWRKTQGSSQVATGISRNLLSYIKGSQASFRVLKENSGLLSRQCRGICPHLEMRWGTRCSSRVLAGTLGFLSSCDKNLGNLLSHIKGVRPLFQFERELRIALEVLQGKMPSCHIEGRNLMVFLELWREAWCSSRVATWTLGNPSCCPREVKSPFNLQGAA